MILQGIHKSHTSCRISKTNYIRVYSQVWKGLSSVVENVVHAVIKKVLR